MRNAREIIRATLFASAVVAGLCVPVARLTAQTLSWVRVTEHAEWKARDSAGEVVFDGKLWLLGGWFTSRGPCPRDVWNSADGMHWQQVASNAAWTHSDLPTALVHDNKIWMMGGWDGGRLTGASASNQVWCSSDGAAWRLATAEAPWCARPGAAGVVFQGKMWILGGVRRYYDGDELLADVWASADGAHWDQITAKAPWPARSCHAAVVHHGKLWVFGGGNYLPTYQAFNDVWCSADGLHWEQVNKHAPWAPRIWFSGLVYRDRMWVLGGWSNRPSKNWNDVWYSSDGKDWKQLVTSAVWSPRHEHSAFVMADKMWVAGGNGWPLVNDVWQIEIPPAWFAQKGQQ